jgi:hypothetical protein
MAFLKFSSLLCTRRREGKRREGREEKRMEGTRRRERRRREKEGTERNGTERNGTERNGTERNETIPRGVRERKKKPTRSNSMAFFKFSSLLCTIAKLAYPSGDPSFLLTASSKTSVPLLTSVLFTKYVPNFTSSVCLGVGRREFWKSSSTSEAGAWRNLRMSARWEKEDLVL